MGEKVSIRDEAELPHICTSPRFMSGWNIAVKQHEMSEFKALSENWQD